MKHTLWLKIAGTLQFISAAFHSISFFAPMQPTVECEKPLIELLNTCYTDNMMGGTTNMHNIINGLSASFTLLLVFGGILNWYLVKKADTNLLKGITTIQVLIFGILFAVCAWLTFLPPVVCTGLVFVALVIARLTFPKEREPYK